MTEPITHKGFIALGTAVASRYGVINRREDSKLATVDSTLGMPAQALLLHSRRAHLLAANLANADTPNYRARDIDFRAALSQARSVSARPPTEIGHARHIALPGASPTTPQLHYRAVVQNSLDGNSVDTSVEQSEFAANAIRYQAALSFLDGRVKSLVTALRGE